MWLSMKIRCKKCNRKLNTNHRTSTCNVKGCQYSNKQLADALEFKDYPKDEYEIVEELKCKPKASKFNNAWPDDYGDSYGYGCGI